MIISGENGKIKQILLRFYSLASIILSVFKFVSFFKAPEMRNLYKISISFIYFKL